MHTRVHPLVWAEALRAAAGDAHRIEVVDHETTITHNHRRWRDRRRTVEAEAAGA